MHRIVETILFNIITHGPKHGSSTFAIHTIITSGNRDNSPNKFLIADFNQYTTTDPNLVTLVAIGPNVCRL